MDNKSKFPFLRMILILAFFVAAMFMMCFVFSQSWKESGWEHMHGAPWFGLIPIFFIIMIAICIFWCRGRRHWPVMCDREGWKHWQEQKKEPSENDALKILKIRLARGEINEDEYDRLIKKISQGIDK
ncbi:MAG: SHOCT domain-containing protein [Candidatus Omnitrophota bacterium]